MSNSKKKQKQKIQKKNKMLYLAKKKSNRKADNGPKDFATETLVDSEDTNGNPLYSGWEENLPPPRWLYQV